ncbi:MAG: aldehyde dehydrogenase family protein [Bdellovibrionales bacterium]|nr:aldehyde dehydrogenase family protein [Bdellovibrionales bacterium]
MKEKAVLKSKGDYIAGNFIKEFGKKKECTIFSPADLNDKVFSFSSCLDHVEPALEAASRAYPSWSSLNQEERNGYLKKLALIYQEKSEEMAVLISREVGKPLWESQMEVRALSQKIDITLRESLPLVQDTSLSSLKSGAKGKIAYKSRGVFLVLGPFNFPLHLPNGHIISALATGNTVIFKASDKSPASAEKWAECFHLAGFPKGVFNLIQGGADIAQSLIGSPLLDGVLFTGSYGVGKNIQKQMEDQAQKILALEMGGKNSSLVWKDADVKTAVYEVLKGAYLTSGQRCSACSRLILHKEIKEEFLSCFIPLSKKLSIGHWRDNPFMGPVIDEKATESFEAVKKEVEEEQATWLMLGERLSHLNGYYVSPSLVEPRKYLSPSFYQNEELFLPFLVLYVVEEEEEAISLINQSAYGLCLSVFSQEEAFAKRVFQKSRIGVFHWNLGTNGASSRLPFGGLGKSGNDRPAGLFSVYTCTTPVAWMQKDFSTEEETFFDKRFFKD